MGLQVHPRFKVPVASYPAKGENSGSFFKDCIPLALWSSVLWWILLGGGRGGAGRPKKSYPDPGSRPSPLKPQP